MNCKNCGSELKTGAKFCTNCGAPVETQQNDISSFDENSTTGQAKDDVLGSEQATIPNNDANASYPDLANNAPPNIEQSKQRKKRLLIPAIVAVIIVAAIAIIAAVISSATETNELKNALNSNSADAVNALYSEAYGSESKIEKYDKLIAEFLNNVDDDLNNHDFDTEAATSGGETVTNYVKDQYGTLILSDDTPNMSSSISYSNQELWNGLLSLIESKTEYCRGVYAYKTEGDYQEAIGYFSQVNENDSLLDDAGNMVRECVEAYINSTLEQVDKFVNDGEIQSGIDLLNSAKTWLDENGVNSDEIQTKINEVLTSYAEKYAANAEKSFKEHDVNAAIGNIEVAMELQPDNADYKTKHDTYQQYLPYYLYIEENVIAVDDVDADWDHYDTEETANDNSTMAHSILIGHSNAKSTNIYNMQYNLSGKYDTVSGKIYIPETYKNTVQKSYFEAYGDGKLLYTSPKMEKGTLPEDISFNVSGVQKLEIKFYTSTESNIWGSEIGISNLTAQKAFPKE